MEIRFRLAGLRRGLIGLLALLVCLGFWAEVVDEFSPTEDPWGLVSFFGLSYERNLPTWVASLALVACAAALAAIARATRQAGGPRVGHWRGLAAAFAWISLDEFVGIHEEMSNWFDYGGVLYFSWVIPASVLVVLFGAAYLRFLGDLPRHFRRRFVLAGALYVGGALLMELPLGYWTDVAGHSNLVYGMIDLVEESLELAGTFLFLYTLVEYLTTPGGALRLTRADGDAS